VAAGLITTSKKLFNNIKNMENILELSRPGHYNEVALLMMWLLSDVSLQFR